MMWKTLARYAGIDLAVWEEEDRPPTKIDSQRYILNEREVTEAVPEK